MEVIQIILCYIFREMLKSVFETLDKGINYMLESDEK